MAIDETACKEENNVAYLDRELQTNNFTLYINSKACRIGLP